MLMPLPPQTNSGVKDNALARGASHAPLLVRLWSLYAGLNMQVRSQLARLGQKQTSQQSDLPTRAEAKVITPSQGLDLSALD